MRGVLAFIFCWAGVWVCAQVAPQEEVAVAVIDRPVQVFLHPVSAEKVGLKVGGDAETAAFLLEVVRATYEAELARILTQHVAPTRVVDGKTQPNAPGWEIRARLAEVKAAGGGGRLGLDVRLEVVDLRTSRVLMTMNVRSGLDGVDLPTVEDDPTVTPWNPPPPRMRKRGVSDELVERMQSETTLAVGQAVYRLLANIRPNR